MRDVLWHGKEVLAALQPHLTGAGAALIGRRKVWRLIPATCRPVIFLSPCPVKKPMAMIMSRKLSKMARRRLWLSRFRGWRYG